MSRVRRFAGVDGCRRGWVAVVRTPGLAPEILVETSFVGLAGRLGDCAAVAVDMPIGLLEAARRGGRACDVAARALLGPLRARSVFSPPVRAALRARDYREALAIQRASSSAGIGISVQSWSIAKKIDELDQFVTPDLQQWVLEGHPEVAFARLAGAPMSHRKRRSAGREQRLAVLEAHGWGAHVRTIADWSAPDVARDDVLDAAVLALTAEAIVTGAAIRLPAEPPCDSRGLRMEIRG